MANVTNLARELHQECCRSAGALSIIMGLFLVFKPEAKAVPSKRAVASQAPQN